MKIALLGPGEFEPWTKEVDQWLLGEKATGGGRVAILPTASALEGDAVFDGWGEKGQKHYLSQGIPAEVVPLKNRDDADDEVVAAMLDRVSMVFFSGGNPAYLARTLSGTAFWQALLTAMARGVAYAGVQRRSGVLG